ncbi:MAG: hypothetical protein MZU91_02225 [Desulfosudis oleivorans]|nr:hypothetical protein [Desulfosudis oleivorans]
MTKAFAIEICGRRHRPCLGDGGCCHHHGGRLGHAPHTRGGWSGSSASLAIKMSMYLAIAHGSSDVSITHGGRDDRTQKPAVKALHELIVH